MKGFDKSREATLEHRAEFQSDIDKILEWSARNQLPLNFVKCQLISFGAGISDDFCFRLCDYNLEFADRVKDLGVILSSPFSFKHHIAGIVNRANRSNVRAH